MLLECSYGERNISTNKYTVFSMIILVILSNYQVFDSNLRPVAFFVNGIMTSQTQKLLTVLFFNSGNITP